MWKKDDDWFWEGNVQKILVNYLQEKGFEVEAANTAKKTTGADIIAKRSNENLIVEVKGWPSDKYMDGPNQGQPKPTQPTLQAKHWLSEAFLTIIRRKSKYPKHALAIGLPHCKRYVALLKEMDWAIKSLGIKIYFVESDGTVMEQ
jgi:Holliday junction resolvase-like predicted endonuclease